MNVGEIEQCPFSYSVPVCRLSLQMLRSVGNWLSKMPKPRSLSWRMLFRKPRKRWLACCGSTRHWWMSNWPLILRLPHTESYWKEKKAGRCAKTNTMLTAAIAMETLQQSENILCWNCSMRHAPWTQLPKGFNIWHDVIWSYTSKMSNILDIKPISFNVKEEWVQWLFGNSPSTAMDQWWNICLMHECCNYMDTAGGSLGRCGWEWTDTPHTHTLCILRPEVTILMVDGGFFKGSTPSPPDLAIQMGLDHSIGKVWAFPRAFLVHTFSPIEQSGPTRQMWACVDGPHQSSLRLVWRVPSLVPGISS